MWIGSAVRLRDVEGRLRNQRGKSDRAASVCLKLNDRAGQLEQGTSSILSDGNVYYMWHPGFLHLTPNS